MVCRTRTYCCSRNNRVRSYPTRLPRRQIPDRLILGPASVQFETTPKAFANVSPGLDHRDNPGTEIQYVFNPERGSPLILSTGFAREFHPHWRGVLAPEEQYVYSSKFQIHPAPLGAECK